MRTRAVGCFKLNVGLCVEYAVEVEGGQPGQLEFVVEQGAQLVWQPVVVFVSRGVVKLC